MNQTTVTEILPVFSSAEWYCWNDPFLSQEPAAITELNYERILSVRLNYEYYTVNYYFMYCHEIGRAHV